MLKKAVKRSLQTLISTLGPERFYTGTKPVLVILTYHRVLPAAGEETAREQPGMYVRPETFRMHMELLESRFELTHLDEWLKKKNKNQPLPKLSVAVTFDDGWKDNYDFAFPILSELRIPATIFLVSDFIGTSYRFWPNRLIRLLLNKNIIDYIMLPEYQWLKDLKLSFPIEARNTLTILQIDEIISQCKSRQDKELNIIINDMEQMEKDTLSAEERNLVTQEEISEMISGGLVKVGSHTRTHTRLLDCLSRKDLEDEILASKDQLRQMTGLEIELFCYPNGDYTNEAVNMVEGSYIGACSTNKGWNTTDSNPYLLKRIGMHEDVSSDRASFLSRLTGIL